MSHHGTYKLIHRARRRCFGSAPGKKQLLSADPGAEDLLGRVTQSDARTQRIVESLRRQITAGDEEIEVRVRRVFTTPRSIYRLELAVPELGYQRITLLEEDALQELLEDDGVRERISQSLS
jgi:hypothetical protein